MQISPEFSMLQKNWLQVLYVPRTGFLVEALYSRDTGQNILLCVSCAGRTGTDAGDVAHVMDASHVIVAAQIIRVKFLSL